MGMDSGIKGDNGRDGEKGKEGESEKKKVKGIISMLSLMASEQICKHTNTRYADAGKNNLHMHEHNCEMCFLLERKNC